MWPARRVVGESLLGPVLALLALGGGLLDGDHPAEAVAVALATALVAPLRRVLPATVLVVAAAGSVVYGGAGPLILVAAWSAGRRIDGLGKAAGVFTAAYGLAFTLSVLWELPHFSPSLLLLTGLLLLVSVIVPGLAGRYWSQRRTLADTLDEYHAQLLRERTMLVQHARIRERQRIAQDMHDSLGHQLALIAVHTGALEVDRTLTGRQREAVGVLREASVAAMHELRDVVGLLRDGVERSGADDPGTGPAGGLYGEDPGAPGRGVAGIGNLVETSRKAGTTVESVCSGDVRPLAPTADHAAYRVVQEGLTNAHKHAPGAAITVALRYEPDSLVVEVANGPTAGPPALGTAGGHQGLAGLGERARLVGGMVHAGPTGDGGFRLACVLPYTLPGGGFPPPADRQDLDAPHSGPFAPTTFVAPTDDFRAQSPAGSPGESDPVINRNVLPKELAKAMSRNRTRNGIAVGCGVAALAGLLLVTAVVVGGIFLMREADEAMIEPAQYEAVTVGQPEKEVRDRLPGGDSFLNNEVDGEGAPPVPAGAECLTLLSTEFGSSWTAEPVYRFCFKDGRLIEKKSFETAS
ncbi:sensor histidine kinase [Streptomyces nitrosporeus]|uniref:sensor histidine kinase n=1 Tax=Streptomyces nitrosporeus TaxID=28894 RepID=UPI003317DF8E